MAGEFYKDFYFGVATDLPDNGKKKPEQPRFAINDLVYYFAPGEKNGNTATVAGYFRDDDGRIKVNLIITRSGEEVTTTQNRIRY